MGSVSPRSRERGTNVARLALALLLAVGLGCAHQDWIDRTLVTVDVSGSWHGKTGGVGGGFLIGDFSLDLIQQGSMVKGTLLVRGAGGAPTPEPIEGKMAGDVLRFGNSRGTVNGELTVSGDEMSGTVMTAAGRRAVALQRVERAGSTGTQPR